MPPGSPHAVDGPQGYPPRCPRPRPGRVGPAGPARAGPGPRSRPGRRSGPIAQAPPQSGLRSDVSYVTFGAAVAEISKSESSARNVNPSRHEREPEGHQGPRVTPGPEGQATRRQDTPQPVILAGRAGTARLRSDSEMDSGRIRGRRPAPTPRRSLRHDHPLRASHRCGSNRNLEIRVLGPPAGNGTPGT